MTTYSPFTADDMRRMPYPMLCGLVDCGYHPQEAELLREVERRRAEQPELRHYSEMMKR